MTRPVKAGESDSERVLQRLISFLRRLRSEGFSVGLAESIDAARLLGAVNFLDPHEFRWNLQSLVCGCSYEWKRFDDLFDAFWRSSGRRRPRPAINDSDGPPLANPREAGGRPRPRAVMALEAGDGFGAAASIRHGGASRAEALGETDFGRLFDPQQMRWAEAAVARIAESIRWSPSRRQQRARRGRWLDLGRTLERSLRYGGWPFEPSWRRARLKPPRLAVLLDASGSMNLYSLMLLRFVRGLIRAFPRSEAFIFHTRLVRVTPALEMTNQADAVRALAELSQGWSGGTRIGACLRTFNQSWGRRMSRTRTVAMVMSDGLDTGPPAELAAAIRRLKKRTRKLLWLNPLLAVEGYRPIAAGMAAALPFVDIFAPAHNMTSLAALKRRLARL